MKEQAERSGDFSETLKLVSPAKQVNLVKLIKLVCKPSESS